MPEFPDTNHSLIVRVQELGDEASWAEFLGIYQPVVLRMARNRGLQDADAMDAMQQIFLAVSRAIPQWKLDPEQPPFRAWLTTVARNAITKTLIRRPRDAGAGSTSVFQLLHQLPYAADDTAEFDFEARREVFRWAAAQVRHEFTAETWAIFWETSVEGKAIAEVSQTSGKTPGAIYVARFRVLSRLKEKVNELSQTWAI
jgi:RNA polymerase sigma-70 factor (ECF subfamily)